MFGAPNVRVQRYCQETYNPINMWQNGEHTFREIMLSGIDKPGKNSATLWDVTRALTRERMNWEIV